MLEPIKELLDKIKMIFYSPKCYLRHYFDELRILVNIETDLFLQKQTGEESIRAVDCQKRILRELDSFEKTCQASLSGDKLEEQMRRQMKLEIEMVQSKLLNVDIKDEEEIMGLRYVTRRILYDLQTHLFHGKSVHFLQKDKLLEIMADYDFGVDHSLQTYAEMQIVGILLIIEDSFIDKSYLELTHLNGKQEVQCFNRQDLNCHIFRFNMKDFVSKDCFNHINLNTQTKETILYLDNFFVSRSLEPGLFQNFPVLKKLSLNSLGLTSLDENTFLGLINLEELNLGDNQLTEISVDTFKGLPHLKALTLHRNKVTCLDSQVFQGLQQLNTLYLNGNCLTALEEYTFKDLIDLEVLDLSCNQLSTLEVNTFKGLDKLRCLAINNNKLSSIKCPDVFQGLPNLQMLRLEENKLNKETLERCRTIKTKCFYLTL